MSVNIDWDNLTFAYRPTEAMFVAKGADDGVWEPGGVVPYDNISLSPAACLLHYGQGLIEGMKAQRTESDKVVLFRPMDYARRMAMGAGRLCMPEFPPQRFVEAVHETVKANRDYIPPYGKGSLYVRPCLWGTGAVLGVTPAPEYTYLIMTCPVGPYFKGGITPIKILITKDFHRSAPKGTGHVKTISNYAGGMYAAQSAKKQGYSEVLYLDGREDRYIEEIGGANFFCMLNGKLVTPTTGTILAGVTRDSIITIASKIMKLDVEERDITVEEALTADEVFCTGTAAVVSPIGSLTYEGQETVFNGFNVGGVTTELYQHLTKIQLQEEKDPFEWVVEVDL